MTTENETTNGWVKLYHPAGPQITFPLSLSQELTQESASLVIRSVDNLIAAGFTVNLPGLMDGENFEQITHAVRREKVNDDGSTTPIMDVYPANGNFRILGLYLNTHDDQRAFEMATGLRIQAMTVFDGSPIERGAKPQTDKYIAALAAPAKLVWMLNPKWEGENDKKHSKRMFVRWDGLRPLPQVEESAPQLPELTTMTIEEAFDVLTPGGKKISSLPDELLHTLANSQAANVTDRMRQAAIIMLQSKGQ